MRVPCFAKGLHNVDPESIQIGGFALIASGRFQESEMATLKISDSYHKLALLPDREFFAAIHSSKEMQITPNLVIRLSESS